MKRIVFCITVLCVVGINLFSRIPEIGAQVFIEPGQSPEQVERWFQLLAEKKMTVCRIRMFESHMQTADGWDFALYDHAFAMAEKYGIKIMATIFPADESVGGFKFPFTHEHQKRIEEFIRVLVRHFKDYKALDTWVLINEPGSGWSLWNEFASEKYTEWLTKQHNVAAHNYLKADYSKELFWRDYTTWYLRWLADIVRSIDTVNKTHVNNHMLFVLLKEYDFPSWMPFLSTLGASIHASWHLGYFKYEEYNMAIAAHCDIIRDAAYPKPFWVTELQGGPNTFSGFHPLTPTKEDIAQWLWTCIGSGAERTIFWTLNARASKHEAGEWAMVDFQNNPTLRLDKAGEIAEIINREAAVFEQAKPVQPRVTLLYSPHSMITFANKIMSSNFENQSPSRSEGVHMKSLLAYYKVLTQMGIACGMQQLDQFDWENKKDHTVILANMISIPSGYAQKMEIFVKNGNTLLISGMTGLFDEYQHNVFMSIEPYRNLLGGGIREWQFIREPFSIFINKINLPVLNMRGVIYNEKADIIARNGDDILAIQNHVGTGRVIWIPSHIDMGAWCMDETGLTQFLRMYLSDVITASPLYLQGDIKNITVRTMQYKDGYISVFVNAEAKKKAMKILGSFSGKKYRIIYSDGNGSIKGDKLCLSARQTLVIVW